jgi:hypothetical protein
MNTDKGIDTNRVQFSGDPDVTHRLFIDQSIGIDAFSDVKHHEICSGCAGMTEVNICVYLCSSMAKMS